METFLVATLGTLDKTDLLAVRRANDRLMNLERFFVDPRGLPDRPETKYFFFLFVKTYVAICKVNTLGYYYHYFISVILCSPSAPVTHTHLILLPV